MGNEYNVMNQKEKSLARCLGAWRDGGGVEGRGSAELLCDYVISEVIRVFEWMS